jgi:prophage regulatory protein
VCSTTHREVTPVTASSRELPTTILRRKQVESRTGLSRSTIYERMKSGDFPGQVSLGPRAVGWLESDIEAWIACQIERSRRG